MSALLENQQLLPLLIALCVIIALVLVLQLAGRRPAYEYDSRPALLTKAEQAFLAELEQVLAGESLRIYAQVRLADIVSVRKGTRRDAWQAAFNRIKSKHIDFVIVDAASFQPLVAIELNDRSHEKPERQRRDALVEQVFLSADMPLLWVKQARSYDAAELSAALSGCLEQARAGEGARAGTGARAGAIA